jgi:hypothetical protein
MREIRIGGIEQGDRTVKTIIRILGALLLTAFPINLALGQDLIVFPAQGQSEAQMEQDKFACYNWAKGQTGFDPMQMPTASSPPPSQQQESVGGSMLKGGIAGGAGGAIIGGIAGGSRGARKGAAIGGLTGGALGGMHSSSQNRQIEQQRQQWEQEQTRQYLQQRNTYNRAYSACLEGKGYTVK